MYGLQEMLGFCPKKERHLSLFMCLFYNVRRRIGEVAFQSA